MNVEAPVPTAVEGPAPSAVEGRRTSTLAVAAAALAIVAWATAPGTPRHADPDQDGPLFPAFTDPNAATSLEIVELEEASSTVKPFKVEHREGTWTIPSHFGYPADGADRLSSIAAGLVTLRRGDVAGDLPADHGRFGVLDPLDDTLVADGDRGARVTVRGPNDVVLADLILGHTLDGRPGLRYIRLPGERRVYTADIGDVEISTRFDDWIERNLLLADRGDIDQIAIRNYTADRTTGSVRERDRVILRTTGNDAWTADGLRANEVIDTYTMNLLVTRLVELELSGVLPKPKPVAERLGQAGGSALAGADVADLAARGFYFTSDGRLLASQGEVLVHTSSGIFYALRFGEPVPATGSARPGRYLFISVGFDGPGGAPPPGEARQRLELLRSRFAPWYFVVPDEDVSKIRVARADLVRPRTSPR